MLRGRCDLDSIIASLFQSNKQTVSVQNCPVRAGLPSVQDPVRVGPAKWNTTHLPLMLALARLAAGLEPLSVPDVIISPVPPKRIWVPRWPRLAQPLSRQRTHPQARRRPLKIKLIRRACYDLAKCCDLCYDLDLKNHSVLPRLLRRNDLQGITTFFCRKVSYS